jgi:hypothetical protein
VPSESAKTSSLIERHDYNRQTQELTLKFHNSPHDWVYEGVPDHVADGLESADSKGKFFGTAIRGKFKSRKVETPHDSGK